MFLDRLKKLAENLSDDMADEFGDLLKEEMGDKQVNNTWIIS